MSDAPQRRGHSHSGWRRFFWLAFGFLVLIAAAFALYPSALINQQVAANLSEFLIRRLGPEAMCAGVELGWRSVRVRDIVLPLDQKGSVLSIRAVEAAIDPLVVLAQPSSYERILHDVKVIGPHLTLRTGASTDSSNAKIVVPPSVFALLSRTDSLRSFSIEGGQFSISSGEQPRQILTDVRGAIVQSRVGEFELDARARGRYPVSFDTRLRGTVIPGTKSLYVAANAEIREGTFDALVPKVEEISSNGGTIEFKYKQERDSVGYSGVAALQNVEIVYDGFAVFIPEASCSLSNGKLSVRELTVKTAGVSADVTGSLDIQDSLKLACEIEANVKVEELLGGLTKTSSIPEGLCKIRAELTGKATQPLIHAEVSSDSFVWQGQTIRDFRTQAMLRGDSLSVAALSFENEHASAMLSGVVLLHETPELDLQCEILPHGLPPLFGSRGELYSLSASASGALAHPVINWIARDSLYEALGSGQVALEDSTLRLNVVDAAGRSCAATAIIGGSAITAVLSDAHVLLPIFYPKSDRLLSALLASDIRFTGDDKTGNLTVSLRSDTLEKSLFSSALGTLKFDGRYARDATGVTVLSGAWSGLTGRNDGFFGRGSVSVQDERIAIHDVYIDEAGLLQGEIRLDSAVVDLHLSIDELPLYKMPVVSDVAEKWRLGGVLSGEISAIGPVKEVAWYADLSLVDGVAQGLPGYWSLLTAQGVADRMDTLHFSFGRGVRSIMEMDGHLDISENSVDLRATFPTSDCSDFLQALAGQGSLLSGDVVGDLIVTGALKSPDILASLRVEDGELLKEIRVDRLALDASLTTEPDGSRLLAIPQLSFSKQDEYRFYAELATVPIAGGEFKALLEGEGDFLDLVQQVDADFTSLGSNGALRIEFGGTWDAPTFREGKLEVRDGVFTYPPAAPGELKFLTIIGLNSQGVVDTGFIQVVEQSDTLKLEFLGRGAAPEGLRPLIIPEPRIELGVLRIATSHHGVPVRLPGFMKPEWLTRLASGSGDLQPLTISAYDSTRLHIIGDADLRDGRFTFPFLSYGGGGAMRPVTKWLVDRLYEARWDLDISVGKGMHYDVEVTGFKDSDLFTIMGSNPVLGTLADYVDHISVDANVTPTEVPLIMKGSLVDSSLRLVGKLGAESGTADYLDQTFWIESLQSDFDETSIFPILSGHSSTYGVDSLGRTVTVRLTIYEIDDETDSRIPFGRFEDVTYVLEADGYPDQEQVLALLGFDFQNISQGKAEQLLTRTALSAAKRMWLDPISRKLERATFFDQISLTPGGGASASLFRAQRENVVTDTLDSQGFVRFLRGSHVTVGKYLNSDVFVSYTGELAEASEREERGRLGLIHYWALQYRVVPLSPDFVLDFAVEYDEASRRRDESIALKYSFALEPMP